MIQLERGKKEAVKSKFDFEKKLCFGERMCCYNLDKKRSSLTFVVCHAYYF